MQNKDLTVAQRKDYFNNLQANLAVMPDKARDRFLANTASYNAYANLDILTKEATEKNPELIKKLKSGQKIAGIYDSRNRNLNLDGGSRTQTARNIYAHEQTHALDGPGWQISEGREWRDAFESEIKAGQLSKYATTNRQEGFAEFGRLLYSSKIKREIIEVKFPKCMAVARKWGLI